MSNQAKDWQEGSYTVHVIGNVVEVVASKAYKDKVDGHISFKMSSAQAECSPGDEFSLSEGVALAMDKLNKELSKGKIEVGDKVRIKNCSLSYLTYVDWIAENVNDIKLAACYDYNVIPKMNGEEYIVKAVAPYENGSNKMLAYIQHYYKFITDKVSNNEPCYLMRVDGLEKVYE